MFVVVPPCIWWKEPSPSSVTRLKPGAVETRSKKSRLTKPPPGIEKLSSIRPTCSSRSRGTNRQLLSHCRSNQSRPPMKWPMSNSR